MELTRFNLCLVTMTPAFSAIQQPQEAEELALKRKLSAFLCILLGLLRALSPNLKAESSNFGLLATLADAVCMLQLLARLRRERVAYGVCFQKPTNNTTPISTMLAEKHQR